jgi:hypothetical protein
MWNSERIWSRWHVPRHPWVLVWSVGNRRSRGETRSFQPGEVRGVGRAAGSILAMPKGIGKPRKRRGVFCDTHQGSQPRRLAGPTPLTSTGMTWKERSDGAEKKERRPLRPDLPIRGKLRWRD